MKKVIVLCAVLLMGSSLHAMETKFDVGPFTFEIPFATVKAVYLLDLVADIESLVGGESPIMSWSGLSINVGAAHGVDSNRNGVPYFSGSLRLPDQYFDKFPLFFGAFAGYDFDNKEPLSGVSANVLLWQF